MLEALNVPMGDVWRVGVMMVYTFPAVDRVYELAALLAVHTACDGYGLSTGYGKISKARRRRCTLESLSYSWMTIISGLWLLREINQQCGEYKSQCHEFIQELQRQKKQLSDKNKYIATLTHEMRNIATRYKDH